MKLTKRLFTLLLALLMASACFVGCSGDDNHNDGDDDKNSTSAEIKDDDQNGKDDNNNSILDIILPHEHTYENGACTVCGELKLSEGLEYTLNDDGESYSLSGRGSCKDAHIVIPATYNGKPVTEIAYQAFTSYVFNEYYGDHSLTGITIPGSVTSISKSAFQNCKPLKTVILSEGLTSIDHAAFEDCTSLTSINIPDSITSISSSAFSGCTSLRYTEYNNGKYLGNSSNPYVILCDVTDKQASSFEIHKDTKVISSSALHTCTSLTSVTIPEGVTSIGDLAFYGCTSLTSITIPEGVTSIGESAFGGCTSLSYNEYKNANYLGSSNNPYFLLCNVINTRTTSFETHSDTKIFDQSAFRKCSKLTSITIGNSVTSIGEEAFDGCKSLSSVTIGNSVTSIGERAFENCDSLKSITIPEGVTSIGAEAFSCCDSLTSITIPEGVTSIGAKAFWACNSLKSITIPASVTIIGTGGLGTCDALTSITVDKNNPFYHSANNCIIKTATKTLVAGCGASVIPTDGSVTSIGYSAFYWCDSLTSITIPESVTSIGDKAFSSCSSLTSFTIPESVTSIGAEAFSGCSSLTSITIPEGVTSIGEKAFYICFPLTSINYGGTKAQWDDIEKGNGWNEKTGKYTIHCTDGDIAK